MIIAVAVGMTIVGLFIRSRIFTIILSGLMCVFYGLFIVYDTQLIFGQKAALYSIDDYILAAMNLYIDIIGLFVELLRLLDSSRNN